MQGKWNITLKTPMGDRAGVLELNIQGATLTGSLSDGEHYAEISEGKVAGNKLSWSAKITKPMNMKFKFTAHGRCGSHQRGRQASPGQGNVHRHARLKRYRMGQ